MVTYERITIDPDVMGGLPCIRGLRFPVATVLAMLADGMGTDGIVAEQPDLTAEDIRESLLYAAQAVRRGLAVHHYDSGEASAQESQVADEAVRDFSFIGLFNGAPDLSERSAEILREEFAKRTDADC